MQPDPTVSVEDVKQLARDKWGDAESVRVTEHRLWTKTGGNWKPMFECLVVRPQIRHRTEIWFDAPSLTALAAAIQEAK